jgi:hypothetical protein
MSSGLSAPRFHNDPEEEQPLAFHDDDDEDDGDNVAPNFHAGDDDALPRSLWPTVQSAFASTGATGSLASRDLRSTASTATTIASKSVSVASHTAAGLRAVHLTAAAAGVAGLTAGTGGIALGAAGGAFTLATVATDSVSLVKTLGHLDGLEAIQTASSQGCQPLGDAGTPATDHSFIKDKVLPWIIHQKKQKAAKKAAGVVGLGLLTGGLRAIPSRADARSPNRSSASCSRRRTISPSGR